MQAAVRAMATLPHVELDVPAGVASMYETAPVGGPTGQTPYLNTVITLRTWLSARELLAALHEIETRLGRWRRIRWEPRTMDIDLLLFGDQSLRENELSVPHPRLHERLFVLEPLAELAAEFVHPLLHRSIADLPRKSLRPRHPDRSAESWDRSGFPLRGVCHSQPTRPTASTSKSGLDIMRRISPKDTACSTAWVDGHWSVLAFCRVALRGRQLSGSAADKPRRCTITDFALLRRAFPASSRRCAVAGLTAWICLVPPPVAARATVVGAEARVTASVQELLAGQPASFNEDSADYNELATSLPLRALAEIRSTDSRRQPPRSGSKSGRLLRSDTAGSAQPGGACRGVRVLLKRRRRFLFGDIHGH